MADVGVSMLKKAAALGDSVIDLAANQGCSNRLVTRT